MNLAEVSPGSPVPSFRRIIQKLYATSLHGLPFPVLPPRTQTERWRFRAFSVRYARQSALFRAAVAGYITLSYPFVAAAATAENVQELRRRSPSAGAIDILRMYSLGLLRNVPPVEFVFYGFSNPGNRQKSAEYLYWTDTPALQGLNAARGAVNADVQDKARFAGICREGGLPHVQTLAVFRRGIQVEGEPMEQVEGDLWVKPLDRNGSEGSGGWRALENGSYQSGSRVLNRTDLIRHLKGLSCIVQRPVRNHPEVEGMTNGAAAVLRIVSALTRSGEVEILSAGIALPVCGHKTTEGALGYFLDLETGTLLSPRSKPSPSNHPDTGEVTLGRQLPLWSETKDLVFRAHREAFPRFATLGWDVVITPEGPKLLETNSGWAAIGVQMQYGPLGHTVLSRIIAEELSLEP